MDVEDVRRSMRHHAVGINVRLCRGADTTDGQVLAHSDNRPVAALGSASAEANIPALSSEAAGGSLSRTLQGEH